MMRFYLLIIFALITSSVFANDMGAKKIIGKPGIAVSFLDSGIVNVVVGETRHIDLAINYSADAINYELQATNGLDVIDLNQSFTREDSLRQTLIIPMDIKVNGSGRYYLHLRIKTSTQGVESQGVLSKIISSEAETNNAVQKKNVAQHQFHILPVVETIKDANDE